MGQPSTMPEDIVLTLLNAHASLVSGTNLFSCPPRPESSTFPRACAFVWSQFSFLPHSYINNQKDDRQFLVDVLLRYPDDFAAGRTLARAMWALLQRADMSSYTNYVMCTIRESDPRYIGVDDADNHRWIFTVNLRFVG